MTRLGGMTRVGGLLLARWKRAAIALLLFWGIVTYFVISSLRCPGGTGAGGLSSDEAAELEARLRAVSAQLDAQRAQQRELTARVRAASMEDTQSAPRRLSGDIKSLDNLAGIDVGPSAEYETLRRRVYSDTQELWRYASAGLGAALKDGADPARLHALLEQLEDRRNALLASQQRMRAADGHAAWREREAAAVSALVQRRLQHLQHPADCDAARKVVCNLNKGCGFGCQLHHIAYCLIFAYATERTLVLNSRGWRYHPRGWDTVFQPLSDSCAAYPSDRVRPHPDMESAWRLHRPLNSTELLERTDPDSKAQVVSLPFIDSMIQRPKFLPLAVPKDIGERVLRFNGDPAAWWVGQMLRYILRPRPQLAAAINDTIQRIDYRTPIVGVHIRRTDKVGTEAAFHHIHEYMKHVQQYWAVRDRALRTRTPRRVYLASDDPKVLGDARSKYPEVEFVGDAEIARAAATHRRYTPASLAGLLVDLTLLARADFLVCTFSSQVGRVAYELMQANRADAADAVQSLDDIYYFGGQNAHNRVALAAHRAPGKGEVELQPGDLLGVAGNHWNGFGSGINHQTNKNGLWPWYKTAEHLVLYPFPLYPAVPLLAPPAPPAAPPPAPDLANFIPRDALHP